MPLWQQSLYTVLSPVLIGLFAFIILKEPISPTLFVSLAVMGIGLFIAVR